MEGTCLREKDKKMKKIALRGPERRRTGCAGRNWHDPGQVGLKAEANPVPPSGCLPLKTPMKNQWKNFLIPIRRMKRLLLKAWKTQPTIPSGPFIPTWSMGGQTIYRRREAMTKKLPSPRGCVSRECFAEMRNCLNFELSTDKNIPWPKQEMAIQVRVTLVSTRAFTIQSSASDAGIANRDKSLAVARCRRSS